MEKRNMSLEIFKKTILLILISMTSIIAVGDEKLKIITTNLKDYCKNFPLKSIPEENGSDSNSLLIFSGDDEPKISSAGQQAAEQLRLIKLLRIEPKKSKFKLKKL